jgi:pSer/pThr/pTyr-binding forkhead associated (FHA) protein
LVRDLGSTNGTRVNGQRVRRAALLPNDQLHIASVKFRVYLGPGEPPVMSSENTQRIEADELQRLLSKSVSDDDSSDEVPGQPVVQNVLPDVYDDKTARPHE